MLMLVAARTALAVAYPLLAHWATHGGGAPAAALALADLAALVLLRPLLQGRTVAWATLAAVCAALFQLRTSAALATALLAPPVVFTAWVGWLFARTLRPGQVPLITRFALALEYDDPVRMPVAHRRYTGRLTAAWAVLLFALAAANTALALVAVPHGVLAQLGLAAPVTVSQQAWSWVANLLDYGVIAAFAAIELALRGRLVPDRERYPPRAVIARFRALGPQFWTGLLR